ncbi:L-ribulose-5-phosphate 3-epimerase [Christensenellaceae bacterium OttesenSCG-928-M15]|nr:L-ribulose-5-phosphate 3-epimerase [Christensenellaceae bacterium OttesenSCG-928-M15]
MLGKHPFGLYEKALPPGDDWGERLKKTKQLGFDYIEMSIDETDERIERLYWPEKRVQELARTALDCGVPIRSICLSAHRRFPFGSADAKMREKARELMLRAMELALLMGVRVIQLAGYDTYYEEPDKESPSRFLEGMRFAADAAAGAQVMLGMEIMDTAFMNSITKHLVFEEAIQSPWYKVYPDLGNLSAWGNDVRNELEKGIKSIVAVHVKDTKPVTVSSPGVFKCVPFGEGTVDFVSCFEKLEALHYAGPYLMEQWHDPKEDALMQVDRARSYIERQFAMAMEKEA